MARPFLCGKCGNWYTPIAVGPDAFCLACERGKHTPHLKTGVVDCHFGHESATPSEIKMVGLVASIANGATQVEAAVPRIGAATQQGGVEEALAGAERAFAACEQAEKQMGTALQWAGVMELPGLADAPPSARFKSLEATEELVKMNRRPAADLATLRRSVNVCGEIAEDVPPLMARARVALGQARQAAMQWHPTPVAPVQVAPLVSAQATPEVLAEARRQANRDRMVRVRAGRRTKAATAA